MRLAAAKMGRVVWMVKLKLQGQGQRGTDKDGIGINKRPERGWSLVERQR